MQKQFVAHSTTPAPGIATQSSVESAAKPAQIRHPAGRTLPALDTATPGRKNPGTRSLGGPPPGGPAPGGFFGWGG